MHFFPNSSLLVKCILGQAPMQRLFCRIPLLIYNGISMKKIGFAAILLLLCAGLFFFVKSGKEKDVQAAEFLPSDVLFYGEQHDFVNMYKEFSNSRLGRTFSRIDYEHIMVALDGDDKIISDALELWKEADTLINDVGFDQLLGKEFSLALFPAKSFSVTNPAKILEERLLLIARPRHNAHIVQFLASYIAKDIEQSTQQYGRYTITRYKIDEHKTLSTATVKGLVLAAFDERLVRKSLNIYDDQANSLAGNDEYQKLRNTFKGAKFFQYASFPALVAQGEMIAAELSEREDTPFLNLLHQWEGWGAMGYGAWKEKGIIKERMEFYYDLDKLDTEVATLFELKPEKNVTLGMVSADTLFYYWTNSLNLKLLWNIYGEALAEQRPGMLGLLQQELKDSVGMQLEDILAMVANECGIMVKDVEGNGIPIPKVMFVMQLKDSQKFMDIFNKLILDTEIPVNTQNYQGQSVSYWGIAPQSGLQPAFTLLGDYLLLSNSLDYVKQVVALQNNPDDTLLKKAGLEELRQELEQKNNSAAYVHIAFMADALKTLVTWAGGIAVLQGPETADKVNILVEELVVPILDGIAMYTQMATRTEVKGDLITVESTILVVD